MTNKQTSALLEAVKIIVELSPSKDDSIRHINRIITYWNPKARRR